MQKPQKKNKTAVFIKCGHKTETGLADRGRFPFQPIGDPSFNSIIQYRATTSSKFTE